MRGWMSGGVPSGRRKERVSTDLCLLVLFRLDLLCAARCLATLGRSLPLVSCLAVLVVNLVLVYLVLVLDDLVDPVNLSSGSLGMGVLVGVPLGWVPRGLVGCQEFSCLLVARVEVRVDRVVVERLEVTRGGPRADPSNERVARKGGNDGSRSLIVGGGHETG